MVRNGTRGLRDILTNEIYIGKYRVAGVEDQVEEYRIIEDGLFKRTKGIMCRFEDGNGAKRPSMPEDMRKVKIDKVFNTYLKFLKNLEGHENSPERIRFSDPIGWP